MVTAEFHVVSASGPMSFKEHMSLEEAILDKVRHLPPAKQEEVLRFADGLQREPTPREVPARSRQREMKWIADNRSAYAGQ